MFGDGIIGRKLTNNNYVTISYLQTQGKSANGASEFSFIGRLINQDGATVGGTNVSLVETVERSRDGDDIESIASIKYYSPRIYSSQYRAVTSSDYEAVLSYIYPNVESVTSYGGEELTPPRYGKVYLSVKPRNGDYLSDFTKRDLISKLKNYAVAGIVPEFIDLKYLFVETESQVYYNPNHNQQPALLKSSISGALTEYSKSIDVNKFGGRFKYSRTVTLIDQVDNAITSNITKVTIRRNLRAEIAQWAQYELCYGNEFHVGESSYNVTSTGFTLDGVVGTVYLADEVIDSKKGRIFFFTYTEGGKPNIIKKNAGTVKYDIGEILIDTVNITSTAIENDVIEIQAVPQSNDVIGLRDLYIKYDMTNTTFKKEEVNDLLVKGLNSQGDEVPNWDLQIFGPAGGVLSNAEDMAKFIIAQFDEKDKELKLLRAQTSKINSRLGMGLGWFIENPKSNKKRMYRHGGNTGGYSSMIIVDVKNKNGIIILSNVTSRNQYFENM